MGEENIQLTVKELKENLKRLKKDYIKAGWLDDLPDEIINDDIVNCINNCTSPVKFEENDTKEQILEKTKIIFRAFSLFKLEDTRVLIIGQDPYPDVNRACGLAFSFKNKNTLADDSLLNIFKAIKAYKEEIDFDKVNIKEIVGSKEKEIEPWNTNLKKWASGKKILLLNTALTHFNTDKAEIEIHKKAWRPFIKQIIFNLFQNKSKNEKLVVFLWGNDAKKIFYSAIKKTCPKSRKIECCDSNTKIYITGHPTPSYNIVHRFGFSEDAKNHFKACDDFIDEGKKEEDKLNIWKGFPENNK